jgi:hypothetical protein
MGIDPSYAVDTPVAYALFAIAIGLVSYVKVVVSYPQFQQNDGDIISIY